MGAFVLGILVGWLAEWLFFTFWVKGKSNDCTDLKDEVAILKSKLARAEAASGNNSSNTKSASTSANKSTASTKTTSMKSAVKSKPAKKAVVKKAPVKKAPAKKAAPKTAASSKPKNVNSNKTTVVKKRTTIKSKVIGNDFTKLSGIGPSMSNTLNELGIDTYEKLAAMDDDILRDMLETSGARLNNNKEAMDSWNEQATLAANNDFDGLKKFQESLKK